jgi:hypothetical protein
MNLLGPVHILQQLCSTAHPLRAHSFWQESKVPVAVYLMPSTGFQPDN